jgi:hypothetical protein
MLYVRFLANFESRFCKMDIFLFFKNVQNEKLPTNLDRPFFGIQFLEFMQYIFVKNMHTHYHIQFEFFMFFLGIFISKYFHAVILHNEYK